MFGLKIEWLTFVAVILLTSCLKVIDGSEVQVLKLSIINEDMEADMEAMKNGRVFWLDGLPQFVEKIKHIKASLRSWRF